MDNLSLTVIMALVLVILVLFLIIRNRKDEKDFESQLKSDYHKPEVHDTDEGEKEKI